MPVAPTYPGVYINEIDSGSRVVSGVATSITAFIGRTQLGLANTATTVFDYGEFQRLFGGRTRDLPMTYAVEDFFANGGSQAVIVRICAGAPSGLPAKVLIPDTASTNPNPDLALTSVLRGPVASRIFLNVALTPNQPADRPAADRHYDVTFTLGNPLPRAAVTSPPTAIASPPSSPPTAIASPPSSPPAADVTALQYVELGSVTDVAPEQFGMALTSLKSVVAVSGGPWNPDSAADTLAGLANAGVHQFTSAEPNTTDSGPRYRAGDLVITATRPGAWADDLDLSLVPAGDGKYALVADHPAFSTPLRVEMDTNVASTSGNYWKDLAGPLAATNLFTLDAAKAPAAGTAADVRKFINKGVPLTRIPDGAGASASMNQFGPLVITASSPGEWGNAIAVSFDKNNITPDLAVKFVDYGITDVADIWNINVYYPIKKGQAPPLAETISAAYLGPIDAPNRVDHLLAKLSMLIAARQPVAAPAARDLLQDPSLVGKDKPNGKERWGVLSTGGDGTTMSSDIIIGNESRRTGLSALDTVDLFNILVIPPDPLLGGDSDMKPIYQKAADYCARHRAILIADPLDSWAIAAKKSQFDKISPADFDIDQLTTRRAVFTYFPRIKKLDPEYGNRERVFSASGMIAGIFALTDVRRGVWKAPAGIEAGMNGVSNLEYRLTDMQNGVLNQVGVNVLREFPIFGKVVWGSRTLAGADALSDDYKYLPIRRLTDYIEESLYRGSKFAVFEPNNEPLWAQLRLTIGAFMADLARQGAFYNYYVLCDKSTTTQLDIDRGRVNVVVAFAPVKPAEFVILNIQQLAGQTAA